MALHTIKNQDGFTVEESGLTNYHIAEDGIQDANGIWVYDLGVAWSAVYWVALGDIDNNAPRGHYPDLSEGEWDWAKVNEHYLLYVNYTGPTFYATGDDAIVKIVNSKNGKVVVDGSHAGRIVLLHGCQDVEVIADAYQAGQGVAIDDSSGIHVHDCNIEVTALAGIMQHKNQDGVLIEDNRVYKAGQAESTAGIYGRNTTGIVIRRRNRIIDTSWGIYWPRDGCGIYCDSGMGGTHSYENTIIGCHHAFQDNSAAMGNEVMRNILFQCDWAIDVTGFRQGAQPPYKSDIKYRNNILINTPQGGAKTNPENSPHVFTPPNIELRY